MPSIIPPPRRVGDFRKEQELKTQGFSQPLANIKPLQAINTQAVTSLTDQSQTGVVQPAHNLPTVPQSVQAAPQNVLNQQRDNSLSNKQYYARN